MFPNHFETKETPNMSNVHDPRFTCFPNFQPSSCSHRPSECCKQRPIEIHHHHYYYYPPQWNNFPNPPNFPQPYGFTQPPNFSQPPNFPHPTNSPQPPNYPQPPVSPQPPIYPQPPISPEPPICFPRWPPFIRPTQTSARPNRRDVWKHVVGYVLPLGAVKGGIDIDGEPIYVGQAYHEHDLLPAKIIPGRRCCCVSYNGAEHAKVSYDVLCDPNVNWVSDRNGHVPSNAVEGGKTEYGETLYIGRVWHKNSQTVGKIHPSHRTCYIPFDGKELNYRSYEVLVSTCSTTSNVRNESKDCVTPNNQEEDILSEFTEDETVDAVWTDVVGYEMPPGAAKGGADVDGDAIYIGRAFHEGDWMAANIIPGKECCNVSYDGLEHKKTSFQVLCCSRVNWAFDKYGRVPSDAIESGKTASGEKLYIGRVLHNSNSQIVGKIHPRHESCFIPFDGKEIRYRNYQVLVSRSNDEIKTNSCLALGQENEDDEQEEDTSSDDFTKIEIEDYTKWVASSTGNEMPPEAVRGGTDIDGEDIYVGKAFHEGDWIPAKIIPGRECCYVSYGGSEYAKISFQVLCDPNAKWVPAYNGQVPSDAIEGGKTSSGEKLYIGRIKHKDSVTVGKIHPQYGRCYIPFDGQEISSTEYEVLVSKNHTA